LLGNAVLLEVDEAISGRARGHVRYTDDSWIFLKAESEWPDVFEVYAASVSDLGLEINASKIAVYQSGSGGADHSGPRRPTSRLSRSQPTPVGQGARQAAGRVRHRQIRKTGTVNVITSPVRLRRLRGRMSRPSRRAPGTNQVSVSGIPSPLPTSRTATNRTPAPNPRDHGTPRRCAGPAQGARTA
jgi:hypothetical protein